MSRTKYDIFGLSMIESRSIPEHLCHAAPADCAASSMICIEYYQMYKCMYTIIFPDLKVVCQDAWSWTQANLYTKWSNGVVMWFLRGKLLVWALGCNKQIIDSRIIAIYSGYSLAGIAPMAICANWLFIFSELWSDRYLLANDCSDKPLVAA